MNQDRCSKPFSSPSRRATILIVGPTPPPYMGPSVATKMIIESELKNQFALLHLDTADRRSLKNIGKLDFSNIYLAFVHMCKFLGYIIRFSPRIVYIPICQTIRGYLRDTFFIVFSKLFGARVIVHLRGGYFRKLYEKSNIFAQFIIKYSLKFVSRAIVLGESLRYIFEPLVPANRIEVVPNGIEPYGNLEPNEKHMVSKNQNVRVLFLSILARPKGFLDVVKAIPEVLQHFDRVTFTFAGELYTKWGERDELIGLINRYELHKIVQLPGVVKGKKKRELLLSSDIFAFPTFYHAEGQPWAVIEAMAAGLPIITTDQGCIKEMVIDGKNGFIIEKHNPHQIAEKIIILLQNELLRKEMGRKSQEHFLKHYTKDKFIGKLGKVFQEVSIEQHLTLN